MSLRSTLTQLFLHCGTSEPSASIKIDCEKSLQCHERTRSIDVQTSGYTKNFTQANLKRLSRAALSDLSIGIYILRPPTKLLATIKWETSSKKRFVQHHKKKKQSCRNHPRRLAQNASNHQASLVSASLNTSRNRFGTKSSW